MKKTALLLILLLSLLLSGCYVGRTYYRGDSYPGKSDQCGLKMTRYQQHNRYR